MEQDVPSPIWKMGLTANAAILPGGKDSPLVLHLYTLTFLNAGGLRGRYLLD